MASNASNATFRFLDLPAELRNKIYHFTFLDTTTTLSKRPRSKGGKHYMTHTLASGLKATGPPGLTHTNKQLRFEAVGFFLSTSTFVMKSMNSLIAFLKALHPSLHSVIGDVHFLDSRDLWDFAGIMRQSEDDFGEKWNRRCKKAGIEFDASRIAYEQWLVTTRGETIGKLWPKSTPRKEP